MFSSFLKFLFSKGSQNVDVLPKVRVCWKLGLRQCDVVTWHSEGWESYCMPCGIDWEYLYGNPSTQLLSSNRSIPHVHTFNIGIRRKCFLLTIEGIYLFWKVCVLSWLFTMKYNVIYVIIDDHIVVHKWWW